MVIRIETDLISLFVRVTCVTRNRADMKDHLMHEFSENPPSLFENSVMRKNTKIIFVNVLKPYVDPFLNDNLQNSLHVIDVGYSVTWPSVCTYQDVLNNYVACLLNNYGPEALVYFVEYSNLPMSTKAAEQCRRTTGQIVSHCILFELDMLVTSIQNTFLGSLQNKARLITTLMKFLTTAEVACLQTQAATDFLISN